MPTLVLTRRYSDDSNLLWRAALGAGWDVERLRTMVPEPDQRAKLAASVEQGDLVFYGETLWADALQTTLGISMIEPTAAWLPDLPQRYRKREVVLRTLGQARALSVPTFIKAPDEKLFQAKVYAPFEDPAPDFAEDVPVLCSEVVQFAVEYRAFVLERKIAAISPYIRQGALSKNQQGDWVGSEAESTAASDFLEELLADEAVEMPPATVVDVGLLAQGYWAVVEANAAWASGLCACDPNEVLKVLRRATFKQGREAATDLPWIRRSTEEC